MMELSTSTIVSVSRPNLVEAAYRGFLAEKTQRRFLGWGGGGCCCRKGFVCPRCMSNGTARQWGPCDPPGLAPSPAIVHSSPIAAFSSPALPLYYCTGRTHWQKRNATNTSKANFAKMLPQLLGYITNLPVASCTLMLHTCQAFWPTMSFSRSSLLYESGLSSSKDSQDPIGFAIDRVN